MRTTTIFLLLATLLTAPAVAWQSPDPIEQIRQAMNERRFAAALTLLQSAIDETSNITDTKQKNHTLATLYFYTAVVAAEIEDEESARAALASYFSVAGNGGEYDREKYGYRFNVLFDEEFKRRSEAKNEGISYTAIYPDFASFAAVEIPPSAPANFIESPEFRALATTAEQNEWKTLRSDSDRVSFVERFWSVRDLSPETPANEFRTEFMRRVRYADKVFGTASARGSLTDRGRVFIILGQPERVFLEKLTTSDRPETAITASSITSESAASPLAEAQLRATQSQKSVAADMIERWVYRPSQLPVSVPSAGVRFAFARREGHPDVVLQREFFAWKTLRDVSQMRRVN